MNNALLIVLCVLPLVTGARGHPDRAGSVITPSRLDEVIARRVLRVCTTGDYRPYSLLKPDGQFAGIDIDLTLKLARSLDVKVQFDFHDTGASEGGFSHRAVYCRRKNANRSLRRGG